MLDEIAQWPLDAESDSLGRYFRPPEGVDAVDAGERPLVTGAPGAGKSAVLAYIAERAGPHRPTSLIAIRDAVVTAMPRGEDAGDAVRAQAMARYVILMAVLDALITERRLEGAAIRDIARAFALDVGERLERALAGVFGSAFIFEVFGANPAPAGGRADLLEGIGAVEAMIADLLDDRPVYVLIDESQERRGGEGVLDALRGDALGAFLCAIEALEARVGPSLRPVIAARRSVFDCVEPVARGRWAGRSLDLSWSSDTLMAMAAFRVARAASAAFQEGEFTPPSVLRRVYRAAERRMSGASPLGRDVWPYIWRRTRGRPRDMIHFLAASARAALVAGKDEVDARTLAVAEAEHAAFMRATVADELLGEWPDAESLLEALGGLAGEELDGVALRDGLEQRMIALGEPEPIDATRRFVDRLYAVSAIGNASHEGRAEIADGFIHIAPAQGFDYGERVVVHPALRQALLANAAQAREAAG